MAGRWRPSRQPTAPPPRPRPAPVTAATGGLHVHRNRALGHVAWHVRRRRHARRVARQPPPPTRRPLAAPRQPVVGRWRPSRQGPAPPPGPTSTHAPVTAATGGTPWDPPGPYRPTDE